VYSQDGKIITGEEGMLFTPSDIVPGNAVFVKFMMKADDETEWMMMSIDAGYPDNFQSMGISATLGDFTNDVFHGDPEVDGNLTEYRFSGMEEIDFDKWYYTLFAVLEDGQVYLRVWPESYPSEYIERTEDFEIPSQKDTWYYVQDIVGSGFIYIDDFWTLEFDSIRSDEDSASGNLPDAIDDILVDFKSIYYSDCSEMDSNFFYTYHEGKVTADGSRITTQVEGWFATPETLVSGNAVLVKLMMKPDDETEWMGMGIETEEEVDWDYQSMEISAKPGYLSNVFCHGNTEDSENIYVHIFDSMREIDFNQWYYILFSILEDGQVYLRVWQEKNPSVFAENIEGFDIPEKEHAWRYTQHVTGSGSIHLDDYWVLEFEALR
jgi:hypothetical protein